MNLIMDLDYLNNSYKHVDDKIINANIEGLNLKTNHIKYLILMDLK